MFFYTLRWDRWWIEIEEKKITCFFRTHFSYVINRWCGDHHETDFTDTSNTTSKANLIRLASTKLLTTFLIMIKNGVQSIMNSSVTPSIYVYFAGPYGSSPIIHLNELTDKKDLFQSLEIDEFSFTIPDTGMVISDICFSFAFNNNLHNLAEYNAYLEYGRFCSVVMWIYRY